MSWKTIEKPKTVLASKSLIDEFVEMEPAPYDRPLSERRLMVYRRILNSGDFRTVVWASAWCAETGCTYRINGKHTSTMLKGLNPIPEFWVTVERYQCETLKEVANLYNTFDSSLASRTTNDINMSFAATIRELEGVPSRVIGLTVSAASFHEFGDDATKKVSAAERAETLMDNWTFAVWMRKKLGLYGIASSENKSTHATGSKYVMRAPVVQAMMATYRRNETRSTEFWKLVIEESAANNMDPTRKLARYLIQIALSGGSGRTTKKVVQGREVYVKCLHAWNAWRKGESTSLNYHADSPYPSVEK